MQKIYTKFTGRLWDHPTSGNWPEIKLASTDLDLSSLLSLSLTYFFFLAIRKVPVFQNLLASSTVHHQIAIFWFRDSNLKSEGFPANLQSSHEKETFNRNFLRFQIALSKVLSNENLEMLSIECSRYDYCKVGSIIWEQKLRIWKVVKCMIKLRLLLRAKPSNFRFRTIFLFSVFNFQSLVQI